MLIYVALKERHCYDHNEIDITIERDHRRKIYNAITGASQQRFIRIFPTFYIELDDDGIELWRIWEKK